MSFEKLNNEFKRIKQLGWIETERKGFTGIGKTLESMLGKSEDRAALPDYEGIEIKTRQYGSNYTTTLFSITPKSKKSEHEIKRLVNKYGYPDKVLRKYNVLNTEVSANEKTLVANRYFFKLEVNRNEKRVYLKVLNWNNTLNEQESYWEFDDLEKKLTTKVHHLAIIHALKNYRRGTAYYKYYRIDFYILKNFEIFIDLLEKGIIHIKFKIGVVRTGANIGKIHDHGTGIEISELDIEKLFYKINI